MRNLDMSRTVALQQPLTRDDIARRIPAIAAVSPHHSRSEKYGHVTTLDIVDAVTSKGLAAYSVSAARTRVEDRRGFEKHMIRFRMPSTTVETRGPAVPEVVVVNSHDGTSSVQIMLGAIVFACANGLVIGSRWQSYSVPHRGADVVGRVIDAAYTVVDGFERLAPRIADMQRVTLTAPQAMRLAETAHALRFGTDLPEADRARVPSPAALLRPRRYADANSSLWSVYNTVQENVITGGPRSRGHFDASGKWISPRKARAVGTIDGSVKINRALWDAAETILEAA